MVPDMHGRSALLRASRVAAARLLGFALLMNGLTVASATAAEPAVLEFQRTFSAPDCATGDLYVDGRLTAVFSASPSLFDARLKSNPFVGEALTSDAYHAPFPYVSGVVFGAAMAADGGASTIRLIALDGQGYWDYDRPRKKSRSLPDDVILLGTRLLNRECRIESTVADEYFGDQAAARSASAILSRAAFNGTLDSTNFGSHAKSPAIAVFTDASSSLHIDAGTLAFNREAPVTKAENVASGSPCLTRLEHGTNTIIHAGGVTNYERRDDTWYCTTIGLTGGIGSSAIEFHRTLYSLEFVSFDQCGSVLGIPIGRSYVVVRSSDGSGGAVWTRCFANEDMQKLADTSHIVFETK